MQNNEVHIMDATDMVHVSRSPPATDAETGQVVQLRHLGGGVHRGLKSRHIQLIALGGSIGTGLFVGTGATLAITGPAPLFMGFTVMSLLVWCVMMVLGEVTVYMPIKGLSVPYLVGRFVEPSLAFAAGWNYWYAYAIVVAAEATAATVVVNYWTDKLPAAAIIAIFLIVILFLNIIAVSWFGEAEFWFCSLKVLGITGLIFVGIILFFGGGPNHDRLGFRYWKEPGSFKEYLVPGSTGRFLAFWTALVRSTFAFVLCPEIIPTAAGETIAPIRNIPKAIRRYIYRLMAFYILGVLVITVLVPYNSNRLLSAINSGRGGAAASPFVVGIQNAGIHVLDHVVNFIILTSACTGQAPKIFARTTEKGVPLYAVLATFSLGLLAFLTVSNSGAVVFNWLTNIITATAYIAWVICFVMYLRFRAAVQFHGVQERLPFRAPFQPYASYVCIFIFSILGITNGFPVFFPSNWSVADFFAAYITIPVFAVLYFGHKLWFRTPWSRHIEVLDIFNDLEEVEEITRKDVKPVPRNFFERVWFWIMRAAVLEAEGNRE